MSKIIKSRERICPICNKGFILSSQNIYKLQIKGKTNQYCSYTCYMAGKKIKESKS